ncbi:hypothetical protein PG993_007340 [Apiospora rasikravindrae]|uniref:Uncharacterized protein n=1 Tax=Apiospora rasikravindrae TaxID=990691 RepID=A0ABR1SZ19_9PEZI
MYSLPNTAFLVIFIHNLTPVYPKNQRNSRRYTQAPTNKLPLSVRTLSIDAQLGAALATINRFSQYRVAEGDNMLALYRASTILRLPPGIFTMAAF